MNDDPIDRLIAEGKGVPLGDTQVRPTDPTRATETLAEMFDRLSVPSFIRDEMERSIDAKCSVAWDEGYARGVRDELDELERAENPYSRWE